MYEGDLTCPWCEHRGVDFELEKEWVRRAEIVNRFKCPSCSQHFRLYFGEKKNGAKYQYTIKGL